MGCELRHISTDAHFSAAANVQQFSLEDVREGSAVSEGVDRPRGAGRGDVEGVADPLVALDQLVHHPEEIDVRLVRHHLLRIEHVSFEVSVVDRF